MDRNRMVRSLLYQYVERGATISTAIFAKIRIVHAAYKRRMTFFHNLAAGARAPEIPESADVYGWLCGSWDLKVLRYRAVDVSATGLTGEVHAAWVLEGRAVQDVWIMPPRH